MNQPAPIRSLRQASAPAQELGHRRSWGGTGGLSAPRRHGTAAQRKAFTYTEVIVIMVILGIVALLTIPQSSARTRTEIEIAARLFQADVYLFGTIARSAPEGEVYAVIMHYPGANDDLPAVTSQPAMWNALASADGLSVTSALCATVAWPRNAAVVEFLATVTLGQPVTGACCWANGTLGTAACTEDVRSSDCTSNALPPFNGIGGGVYLGNDTSCPPFECIPPPINPPSGLSGGLASPPTPLHPGTADVPNPLPALPIFLPSGYAAETGPSTADYSYGFVTIDFDNATGVTVSGSEFAHHPTSDADWKVDFKDRGLNVDVRTSDFSSQRTALRFTRDGLPSRQVSFELWAGNPSEVLDVTVHTSGEVTWSWQ